MRKKSILILTLIVIVGIFVTGCSGSSVKEDATKTEEGVKETVEHMEEEIDTVDEDVEGFGAEGFMLLEEQLKEIEAEVKERLESGNANLELLEEDIKDGFDDLKDFVEKDAGIDKEKALNLLEESKARVEEMLNK